jgi:hypothetical protein
VEQELHILPGHPSFSAIKKLCSFSWTFPENSRRPGGFYSDMMFMIPKFRPEKGSISRPRKYSVLETSKRSEGSKGLKESKNNS